MAERKNCEECGHFGVIYGHGLCGKCYAKQRRTGTHEAKARSAEYMRRYKAKKLKGG